MRTRKALLNSSSTVICLALIYLFEFLNRVIFAKIFSQDYLGISGLFNNILSLLSLVELGIGPAIVFSLYKPLSQKDIPLICSLMRLYKRVYISIGFFIILFGILFTPFYKVFLKEIPNIPDLDAIYLIYIFNTGVSYFFSYKSSLLNADQNKFILNIFHFISKILLNIFQIIILIFIRNFIFYLSLRIFFTLLENTLISIYANRKYPFLKIKHSKKLPKQELKKIVKNVKAMIMHKLGSIIVFSTDNLLISKYIGIAITGIYSNYMLVVNALSSIMGNMFDSLISSVGNLAYSDNKESLRTIFDRILFITNFFYGISFIILFNAFPFFIRYFFGVEYVLSLDTVFFICFSFYLTGMRAPLNIIRNSLGLVYFDRWKPLFEGIVNLIVSLLLLKFYGLVGVILGTICSTSFVCIPTEVYISAKYGLETRTNVYWKPFFINLIKLFIVFFIVTKIIFMLTLENSFVSLLIVCCITSLLSVILFLVFSIKNESLYFYISLVKSVLGEICDKLSIK